MTSIQPPPTYEVLQDQNGKAKTPWLLFFNQMYVGDAGTSWTPTFQNLTTSGTPTITGRYYRLSDYLTYFNIIITPGTNTSSTVGSTYCDNFPLSVLNNGACVAVGGAVGVGTGIVQADTGRIYTPTWSTVSVPVSILGIAEAG